MRDLVESARVARLASVDPAGNPHLVPICFAVLGDVVYSAVDHKPKRSPKLRRIANIETTGQVCVLVDEYHEDWSALRWVRLDGHGYVVDDPDEAERAMSVLTAKYPQYAADPPDGPVLAVEVLHWSGWQAAR
ncbi:MAG: TIGR03668 family PPOX class F420-dependent oxidoreductase [Micromonosporaceae bacterium]